MAWWYRHELAALRHYALFIGYPRSGHTLVAALLDAHPRMLFANGLDVARYVAERFTDRQIAALSIWNSLRFTRHGRQSNGFDYSVPHGQHGSWEALDVVGDKSGDLLSARLAKNPELLPEVLRTFEARTRFIHVVRNPFDCIATIAARDGIDLRHAADGFFALCEANLRARAQIPSSAWQTVSLEQLIERPAETVAGLCRFLGQDAGERYLAGCRRLLFPSPRRSRDRVDWNPRLVADIESRSRSFDWLKGYDFERSGWVRSEPGDEAKRSGQRRYSGYATQEQAQGAAFAVETGRPA